MLFLIMLFPGNGYSGLHGSVLVGASLALALACLITAVPFARSGYSTDGGGYAAAVFGLIFGLAPLGWAFGILYGVAVVGGWLLIPEFRQKSKADRLAAKRKEAERVAKDIERLEAEILSGSQEGTP